MVDVVKREKKIVCKQIEHYSVKIKNSYEWPKCSSLKTLLQTFLKKHWFCNIFCAILID